MYFCFQNGFQNRDYCRLQNQLFKLYSPVVVCLQHSKSRTFECTSGKCLFFKSNAPHVILDFVVLPPGHGSSVTDFWVWDAHEAQLRCPDDVSGDTGGCSASRALKPKFYQPTQTMVTAGILPFRENSHGRPGNRTRDLIISSQRLWPLDHEAGHIR